MPGPDHFDRWDAAGTWPGEFVRTVEARRRESAPGRAQFWLRPTVPLLDGESISATSRALSTLDIANGITPRTAPDRTAFPNLDTTVHLFTEPTGDWLGFDATVSFGDGGIGLTHAVLHDQAGPIGTMEQILTIRSR